MCCRPGHNVVVLAHAAITKFEQPDAVGNYDRWSMKTSKQVAPLLREWCDMLLFANYKTVVEKVGDGKNAKSKASGGRRVLYTAHHPCWDAKNRFDLPEEVPFDYASIAACIPGAMSAQAPKPEPQPCSQPEADILPQPAAGSKAGGSAAARTAAGKLREKCSAQSGRAGKAGRSDERQQGQL